MPHGTRTAAWVGWGLWSGCLGTRCCGSGTSQSTGRCMTPPDQPPACPESPPHPVTPRPLPQGCWWVFSMTSPPDKERDKAKEKYVRSLWKLYALHNQYVLAVRAAALHHHHHYQRALPSLHQSLYSLQQEMVLIL